MSLERDNERIEALRARNVARTNRFLDARRRTIGLDVDALDHQMQERRARKEREEVIQYTLVPRLFNQYCACKLFFHREPGMLWGCCQSCSLL